uniref:Uncharacterized protein n=1 Tax=Oryza nivara TaxID=4536 RepID=A0A0E0FSJ4_ORYNI
MASCRGAGVSGRNRVVYVWTEETSDISGSRHGTARKKRGSGSTRPKQQIIIMHGTTPKRNHSMSEDTSGHASPTVSGGGGAIVAMCGGAPQAAAEPEAVGGRPVRRRTQVLTFEGRKREGPRTPALHLALVRPPPRVSWEAHRRNRRGARPSCPTAATGFAWRRPAAGPNDAVVQVGGCAARARRVEETALLLPRHTSRFRQPRLHNGFRRPSPHPEPAQVGCPLRRRREVTPPPGFVQGCAAARRHHRAVRPGGRPPPCTPGHGGRAGRPSASLVAAARLPAGFAGAADKGEVKRRRTRT